MRVTIDLDPAAALHLAVALGRHVDYCANHDVFVPPILRDLALLAEQAKHGTPPERTQPDADRVKGDRGSDDHDDLPPFLTRAAFASRCGKSERTVRRWVDRGLVAATVAGIPRAELERLQTKGTKPDA